MINKICELTRNTMTEWENPYGWAPNSAAHKIDEAMLSWIVQITECLKIWTDKNGKMTDGELILAKTNLGSLIESWLKFFYCVFYEDYIRNPKITKNGEVIEPNNMSFENLKIFSRGILWDQGDSWDKWVEIMQQQRNAIHSFNFRNIGCSVDFLEDIRLFYDFITMIAERLPESPVSARSDYY